MKLHKLKYKALAVLAILAAGMGFVGTINIQNTYAENTPTTSMFVTPMSQKIILSPGETYTGTIAISNSSNASENLEYEVSIGSYKLVSDADSKDDYGGVDVDDISNRNVIMQWTSLDKDSGIIAPNNQDIVTFIIKVPKDAPAGAQYASILVSEKDKKDKTAKKTSSINSKFQLASAILANVAGETVEKGSISENDLPSILTNSKLEATSMVRNEGNIYTDATYTLQVWPLFNDEELCTNEEKAETSMILPNTERYHVQTCDLPAVGIFRAKQVVKIFGEESVLEKTIIVCPIWLMILVLAIIIAIVIAVVIIVKKNKSKESED